MKQLALAAFAILTIINVNAQTPDYFSNQPEWRLDSHGQPDCIFHDQSVYYLSGDSIVNDTSYHVMFVRTYRTYTYEPGGGGNGGQVDCGGPYFYDQFYGLFRQEDKKIYGKTYLDDEIQLIADYNLQAGDSIHMYGLDNVILEIDSIQIGSEYHDIFYYGEQQEYDYFIEGIGNSSQLFGMVELGTLNYSSSFVCYSQNGETLYENPMNNEDVCFFDVLILEHETRDISVYPIPAENILHVLSDFQIADIEIYDLQGRRIEVDRVNKNSLEILKLSKGVYILKAQIKEEGKFILKRFIKE